MNAELERITVEATSPNRSTITAFTLTEWGKSENLSIGGGPAEILNEQFRIQAYSLPTTPARLGV